jgi:hypothetical protein
MNFFIIPPGFVLIFRGNIIGAPQRELEGNMRWYENSLVPTVREACRCVNFGPTRPVLSPQLYERTGSSPSRRRLMTEDGGPSFRRKVAEAAARLVGSLREQVPKANARPDPLFWYLTKLSATPLSLHSWTLLTFPPHLGFSLALHSRLTPPSAHPSAGWGEPENSESVANRNSHLALISADGEQKLLFDGTTLDMAERVGFEPTVEFPRHTLSKRAP